MSDQAPRLAVDVPDPEAVWRVCNAIEGDCKRCPPREDFREHKNCTRGCYVQAAECVNIVQTGNPWRKTEGVKPPWTVIVPAEKD